MVFPLKKHRVFLQIFPLTNPLTMGVEGALPMASRPEDAADDLDPLADDSAGFLEELRAPCWMLMIWGVP